MFPFYLRRTLCSLRRTPGLSSVMIINMALGLSIWIIAYTAVDAHERVPVTHGDRLFHVDWGTAPAYDLTDAEIYEHAQALAPHFLLSDHDARALSQHPTIERSARTFTSRLTVRVSGRDARAAVRFTTRELFPLFELRFRYGVPFTESADRGERAEVVLDDALNRQLFGGGNSVGRRFDIDGRSFVVTGVLAKMATRVRAYDFSFSLEPALYLPYEFAKTLGAMPEYLSRRSQHGPALAELFGSDDGFVHLWVELDPTQVPSYSAFLAERANAAHMPPRARPMVLPAQEFMAESVPISSGFYMFRACAFVALLACIVNLSRLLIVKYQARAPELAVQRALGATRRSVFAQHMLEALVVASAAVALALPLAALSLLGINGIVPDRPAEFALDLKGVLLVCMFGFGGGLLAGMVPALRMASSAPAAFLRLQ